jgi:hypothetical protein
MTITKLSKLITSLQHRRKLSLSLDDLESEIIAFLNTQGYQDKPVIINGWEILFDGKELLISEAPVENTEQLELFEQRSFT